MGRQAAISVTRESPQGEGDTRSHGTPVSQSAFAGLPALVLAGDDTLKFCTAHAAALVEDGRLKAAVHTQVAIARADGRARLARVTFSGFEGQRHFDLTLIPSVDGEVLIVAKEASFEANLIAALTTSRELFRDLAACNAEFAFETDENGVFSWVSPRGLLGHAAAELQGARPQEIFGEVAGVESFTASEKVEDLEVWLHAKDGSTHCLVVSTLAVSGAGNVRRATRGVARDVTALRDHERRAWRSKRRDDLAGAIVEAMRAEIDPSRMLSITAAALKAATKADAVSIVSATGKVSAHAGAAAGAAFLALHANAIYHGTYNATITLLRREGRDPFGDDERQLLAAVMPQLGVAVALGETLIERSTIAPSRSEVPSC